MTHYLARDYKDKGWYRFLQVLRVLAYLFAITVSIGACKGYSPYSITDPFTRVTTNYPGQGFNVQNFLVTVGVMILIIELIESTIVYIFGGRSFIESMREKLK